MQISATSRMVGGVIVALLFGVAGQPAAADGRQLVKQSDWPWQSIGRVNLGRAADFVPARWWPRAPS